MIIESPLSTGVSRWMTVTVSDWDRGADPDRAQVPDLRGLCGAAGVVWLCRAHRRGDDDGFMTQGPGRTDHQLKAEIIEELDWTPSVKADRIGVSVTDGAVTLSGQVLSYPEKAAATAAVLRIHGVTAAADEIEVQHAVVSRDKSFEDADVARAAGDALDYTAVVPAGAVKATVHHQVITLSGTVDWHYQREAAYHAVAGLPGVTGVHNTITMTPSIPVSPAEAKTKITAALIRHARLNAKHITVDVTHSAVTLTGSVSSVAERIDAEHAAWATPGVVFVHNELMVTPTGPE